MNSKIKEEESEEFSSIYAINTSDLFHRIATFGDDKFIDFFEEKGIKATGIYSVLNTPKIFDELVMQYSYDINFIIPVHPTFHHERSNPQASVHISIGNLKSSFLSNFSFLMKHSASEFDGDPYIKFRFPNEIRKEALYDLNLMNINYSSLFPGFSGFIKNLYLDYECSEHRDSRFFRETFSETT